MNPGEIPSPNSSDYFNSIKFLIVVGHRPPHARNGHLRQMSVVMVSERRRSMAGNTTVGRRIKRRVTVAVTRDFQRPFTPVSVAAVLYTMYVCEV